MIRSYGDQVVFIQQPDQSEPVVPKNEKKFKGYFKIARHYGWALNQTFVQQVRSNLWAIKLFEIHQTQLSNLWLMPNSVSIGFGRAINRGSSRRLQRYPTQSGASSFLLCSIEGLNGAHFFVIGSVYLVKTAFLAFLNSLPDRFARLKLQFFAPTAFICPSRRQPIYFKACLYIRNLLKVSPNSL